MPTTTYLDSTLAVSAIGSRTDAAGADVTDYTAEEARFAAQILTGGYLQPADAFVVREAATPNMSVVVGSGTAKADYYVIAGQVGGQGNYIVRLDAVSLSVQVPAADASQQRRDEVYLVVQDDTYDASARGLPRLGYRKGDLGGVAPGPDAGWEAYALLASYPVTAGATTITDEDIVDERVASGLRGDLAVTDHGALLGLGDDDHPQYLTNARGDVRYYLKAQVDTALTGKANTAHAHAAGDVTSGVFPSARIPTTLPGTQFTGAVSATSIDANTGYFGGTYASGNNLYVGQVATEYQLSKRPGDASKPSAGLTANGSFYVAGPTYTGASSGAINGQLNRSSAWFGLDNNGPFFRFYWSGTNIQFVRCDDNTITKTFVIDHPTDESRYLVHATTESPHNGVEYWGEAEIVDGKATVQLPDYFEALCSPENRQVQVSVVLPDEDASTEAEPDFEEVVTRTVTPVEMDEDGKPTPGRPQKVKATVTVPGRPAVLEHLTLAQVAASTPRGGEFRIACSGPDGTRVAWLVKAVRKDVPPLVAEPLRSENDLYGDGPYTYLVAKDAG